MSDNVAYIGQTQTLYLVIDNRSSKMVKNARVHLTGYQTVFARGRRHHNTYKPYADRITGTTDSQFRVLLIVAFSWISSCTRHATIICHSISNQWKRTSVLIFYQLSAYSH
jgi:hypothetical protein